MIALPFGLHEPTAYLPLISIFIFAWAGLSRNKGVKAFRRQMAKSFNMRHFYREVLSVYLCLVDVEIAFNNDWDAVILPVFLTALMTFETSSSLVLHSIHELQIMKVIVYVLIFVSYCIPSLCPTAVVLTIIAMAAMLYPSFRIIRMARSADWPKEVDKQDELIGDYYYDI